MTAPNNWTGATNFIDIIKITTMLIKNNLLRLTKIKRIRNYESHKMQFSSAFHSITKIAEKNSDVNWIQGVCHVIYICF